MHCNGIGLDSNPAGGPIYNLTGIYFGYCAKINKMPGQV